MGERQIRLVAALLLGPYVGTRGRRQPLFRPHTRLSEPVPTTTTSTTPIEFSLRPPNFRRIPIPGAVRPTRQRVWRGRPFLPPPTRRSEPFRPPLLPCQPSGCPPYECVSGARCIEDFGLPSIEQPLSHDLQHRTQEASMRLLPAATRHPNSLNVLEHTRCRDGYCPIYVQPTLPRVSSSSSRTESRSSVPSVCVVHTSPCARSTWAMSAVRNPLTKIRSSSYPPHGRQTHQLNP